MFYQLVKNLRSTWYLSGARESLRIELLEASRPIFRISQPGSLYVCTFVCHFVKEKRNNERERQRGSDRAFQHFGLSFYQKCWIDLDRTRTCNPQIRSLVPYPLGHKVSRWRLVETWKQNPLNVATTFSAGPRNETKQKMTFKSRLSTKTFAFLLQILVWKWNWPSPLKMLCM